MHMLQNKDNDPYRLVLYATVSKSLNREQKKTKVRLHLPIYIYIYGKIQKRSLAKSTMYIKTQAFDCLFTA